MSESFFRRLHRETPTRVWVNNPTPNEIGLALAEGAVGCTTNPGYAGGLVRRAPAVVRPVIAAATAAYPDDEVAAQAIQLELVGRIVERFRPLFDASGGTAGFVSCQGSPAQDADSAAIVAEGRAARALGPNATPKIPATEAGLAAFEALVADGSPTIVTEVFSLAQLVEANERYLAVTAGMPSRPPFFMSPITGIFADYLRTTAAEGPIGDEAIALVGVAFTRACYELCLERNYPVTLLAGGARVPFDLTGLVGARLHATINWSTFAELLAAEPDAPAGYADPLDPAGLASLQQAYADVRAAFRLDGLSVAEFESFGPVQYFRDRFVEGWLTVREAVRDIRSAQVAPAS